VHPEPEIRGRLVPARVADSNGGETGGDVGLMSRLRKPCLDGRIEIERQPLRPRSSTRGGERRFDPGHPRLSSGGRT
jgi:hypothetical protein